MTDPHYPNAHVRAGCDHRVGCKVFPAKVNADTVEAFGLVEGEDYDEEDMEDED